MCLLHYIVVKESKSFGATTECSVGGGWVITVAALLVWVAAGVATGGIIGVNITRGAHPRRPQECK